MTAACLLLRADFLLPFFHGLLLSTISLRFVNGENPHVLFPLRSQQQHRGTSSQLFGGERRGGKRRGLDPKFSQQEHWQTYKRTPGFPRVWMHHNSSMSSFNKG
ncbi:hypothetical protein B0H14DRAFT_3133900 [Mycena olivaceomarginata]|nr:hypothetical protein B0H14DRAFT_3133900 [Mycena olivaceomarginata]